MEVACAAQALAPRVALSFLLKSIEFLKSTLIPVLTAQVMRVFSVQDRTQPLIPLNAEHSKRLLVAIPNRNCLTHLAKQSACKELGGCLRMRYFFQDQASGPWGLRPGGEG